MYIMNFLLAGTISRRHTLHRGGSVAQTSGGKMQVLEVPLPGDNRGGETEGWRANQYLLTEENVRCNIVAFPKAFPERRP